MIDYMVEFSFYHYYCRGDWIAANNDYCAWQEGVLSWLSRRVE